MPTNPTQPDAGNTAQSELRVALQRGLLATLGDTYDCTRVWEAWGVGTMDQDDFLPVLDRLDELIDALVYEINESRALQEQPNA